MDESFSGQIQRGEHCEEVLVIKRVIIYSGYQRCCYMFTDSDRTYGIDRRGNCGC